MSDPLDTSVPESEILGEHTYPGVLFCADTETPVNITTGETPAYAEATIDDAKAFADRLSSDSEKPYVAKAASVETQIETQSQPYTGCVFHHFSIVGGMEMHKAYAAVWDHPKYDVTVIPDYTTGNLTITVTN